MGHLGLTPQSIHALGGFKVQGKELDAARAIVDDAVALAEAGCFAIVLECVPDAVARMVTDTVAGPDDRHRRRPSLRRPGARVPRPARLRGPACAPKFVRRYAELERDATDAVAQFAADVRAGTLPVERRDVPRDRPTSPRRSASTAPTTREPEPRSRVERRATAAGVTRSRPRLLVAVAVGVVRRRRSCCRRDDDGRLRRRAGDGVGVPVALDATPGVRAVRRVSPRRSIARRRRRCLRVVVADDDRRARAGPARARATSAATTACCSCSTRPTDGAVHDVGRADAARHRLLRRRRARRSTALRMKPCPTRRRRLPGLPRDGPFRYALETLAGELPSGALRRRN